MTKLLLTLALALASTANAATCLINQHVKDFATTAVCSDCAAGKSRTAGDDTATADTACDTCSTTNALTYATPSNTGVICAIATCDAKFFVAADTLTCTGCESLAATCTSAAVDVTCTAGSGLVSDTCTACVVAKYAAAGNSAVCADCAANSITDTGTAVKGTTCTACADGTFSATSNVASCTACDKATGDATVTCTAAGLAVVVTCADGYYKSTASPAVCTACTVVADSLADTALTCTSATDSRVVACASGKRKTVGVDAVAATTDPVVAATAGTADTCTTDCADGTFEASASLCTRCTSDANAVTSATYKCTTADNARFVGNVGWRQNEQTFDAAMGTVKPFTGVSATYAYVNRVQTIFGTDSANADYEGDTQFIHLGYSGLDWLDAVAYAYLVDLDDRAVLSSQSYGARAVATFGIEENTDLIVIGEYANQSDYGSNPAPSRPPKNRLHQTVWNFYLLVLIQQLTLL